jgi:hypothetical protein
MRTKTCCIAGIDHLGILLPVVFHRCGRPTRKGTRAVIGQFGFSTIVLKRNKLVYLYAEFPKTQ